MTDNAIPSSEILELIRGQARVEAKIDTFLGAQSAMKTEIDGLKADIGAVKSDVAVIKSQRSVFIAYGSALVTAGSIAWMLFGEKIKKIFGI
ncbi:hypothetical protein NN6n1_35660 [Shinella zoogloeoides]